MATVRAQVGLRGQREVLMDRLPTLPTPTLVLWGARDRVLPRSEADEAIAHLRNGSLEILPDCGHLPHVDCPNLFVAALDGFLGERGSPDTAEERRPFARGS